MYYKENEMLFGSQLWVTLKIFFYYTEDSRKKCLKAMGDTKTPFFNGRQNGIKHG
jgi:hypothetical protein